MSDHNIPVIIGAGEVSDHPDDLHGALEPLRLMAEALQQADEDAGGGVLAHIDSLDVINLMSWNYADIPRQLSRSIGIEPARAEYGPVGGESPVRCLHAAALRIATGQSQVAAICGAEALNAVSRALKSGVELPWTPQPRAASLAIRADDFLRPIASALDVTQPLSVYPFYEAASAASWGQTPREAQDESGRLWAQYSQVAASNPNSWTDRAYSALEITAPGLDNRLIAWPYTRLLVANPNVNQGAAILVSSLAYARAQGIPDDRLIHIWGGASAVEPRDYLDRDGYDRSHAQDVVLERARLIAGGGCFDAVELYSCFPCVPKMARRVLNLPAGFSTTVTGGLSFFGAPLNNYMTHAACAMVRALRQGRAMGLLYGQGEFVTKHHALVLSKHAPACPVEAWAPSVQSDAGRRRGTIPRFVEDASGLARLETFTVLFNRDGTVRHGVVIVRPNDGTRALARVRAGERATLEALTGADAFPIGAEGRLSVGSDGVPEWKIRLS